MPAAKPRLEVQRRLLIINNLPSFYRIKPFEDLEIRWRFATGGPTVCLFQARRNYHQREEWFFTPDDDITVPHQFLSQKTVKIGRRVTYLPRFGIRSISSFRPSHILVAGWDTPVALAAARYRRSHSSTRLMSWVESNPSTTSRSGRFANGLRGAFFRSADAALVPTKASANYVTALRGSDLPILEAPNAVHLARIPARPRAEPSASRRLVFLGDLSHRKGFDLFLRACNLLASSGWTAVAWGADTEGLASAVPANCAVQSGSMLSSVIPKLRADVFVCTNRPLWIQCR